MAFTSTNTPVTVGTSRVRITADATALATPLQYGFRITYSGANNVYWGGSTVTTSVGCYPIVGETQVSPADCPTIGDLYLISNTAGQTVYVNVVGQVVTIS